MTGYISSITYILFQHFNGEIIMPNHCLNDLSVTGPEAEVIRFVENAIKTSDTGGCTLNEDFIMPYPTQYKELDERVVKWQKDYNAARELVSPEDLDAFNAEYEKANPRVEDGYSSGGYEWCISNWGTKWGSYDGTSSAVYTDNKGVSTLEFSFWTAWGPYGEKFMIALSSKFPTLEITNMWDEPGMQFQGRCVLMNGEIIEYLTYQ